MRLGRLGVDGFVAVKEYLNHRPSLQRPGAAAESAHVQQQHQAADDAGRRKQQQRGNQHVAGDDQPRGGLPVEVAGIAGINPGQLRPQRADGRKALRKIPAVDLFGTAEIFPERVIPLHLFEQDVAGSQMKQGDQQNPDEDSHRCRRPGTGFRQRQKTTTSS
jgi:hypothetical protein